MEKCIKCNTDRQKEIDHCNCDCHIGEINCDVVINIRLTPEQLESHGLTKKEIMKFAGWMSQAMSSPDDYVFKKSYVDDLIDLGVMAFKEFYEQKAKTDQKNYQ